MPLDSFITVMKVTLSSGHLRPGRTRHAMIDKNGERDFPPFIRLEIARYHGDSGFYLLHICEDGSIADTHHGTIEEALHQAEFEFGVRAEEWKNATGEHKEGSRK